MIQNYMELLVQEVLHEVKDSYNIKSEKSLELIQIIALNNLQPIYFLPSVTDGEKKAFLLDRQRRISVLAKITEAVNSIDNI